MKEQSHRTWKRFRQLSRCHWKDSIPKSNPALPQHSLHLGIFHHLMRNWSVRRKSMFEKMKMRKNSIAFPSVWKFYQQVQGNLFLRFFKQGRWGCEDSLNNEKSLAVGYSGFNMAGFFMEYNRTCHCRPRLLTIVSSREPNLWNGFKQLHSSIGA